MADLVIVKPSIGKGDGVFASKALEPGDVMMRDSVKMKLHRGPNDVTNGQVQQAFNSLSKEDQASFMHLHEGDPRFETKVMRTFKANAFSAPPFGTIYLKFSNLNHSCNPNAEMTELDNEAHSKLVAIRPIAKGEEVFISYLGLPQDGSKSQRALMMRECYGFECSCSICKLEGRETAISDGRRQLISAMASKRIGFEPAASEMLDNVHGMVPGQRTRTLGYCQRQFEVPLTGSEKVVYGFLTAKLLEAEGYPGRYIGEAYAEAAAHLLTQGRQQKSLLIIPSLKYILGWTDAAVKALSKVRKPGSQDVKDLLLLADTIKKSQPMKTVQVFVRKTYLHSVKRDTNLPHSSRIITSCWAKQC